MTAILVAACGLGLSQGPASADPAAAVRPISTADILFRASIWVEVQVPYSQHASAPDATGRKYRTDCSGFISMAWGLARSLTTLTLPDVSTAVAPVGDYAAVRPGDMLDSTTARHAVLFVRWADRAHTTAVVMEEPHPGAVARIDSSYYTTTLLAAQGFVAYRYDHVRSSDQRDQSRLVKPAVPVAAQVVTALGAEVTATDTDSGSALNRLLKVLSRGGGLTALVRSG